MDRDGGLLLLRVGTGGMFMAHGVPKLLGGPARWEKVGSAMESFGVDFGHVGFGLLAALAESLGGLLLALGVAFQPACLALLGTMCVAAAMHIDKGHSFPKTSHSVEAGVLFLSLLFIGPGKHVPGRAGR